MRRNAKTLIAAVALAGMLLLAALPSAARTPVTLHVATGDGNPPELAKTVPITRHEGQQKRVVLSVDPPKLGRLSAGDLIKPSGELEVSVTCLEPMPKCVGRLYDFSPHVEVRPILASSKSSRTGLPVGRWKRITCSQQLPNRNHHCTLVVGGDGRRLVDTSKLPCPPSRCHLNLVLSAYNDHARRGNVLVIGGDSDGGIEQDKGRLNAGVYRPGDLKDFPPAQRPLTTRRRMVGHIPVAEHDGNMGARVLYSVRLNRLHAGEQLVVVAHGHVGIGGLPYNALIRSQLILAEGPHATNHKGLPGLVESSNGEADESNGFNCTRGPSDFRTPCLIQKVGVVRMVENARRHPFQDRGRWVPLYLNLVTSAAKEYGGQYRSGDRAKVGPAGFIRVYRYSPQYKG